MPATSLYDAADELVYLGRVAGVKADPKPIAEMDPWRRRALRIFRNIYAGQAERIISGIANIDRVSILAMLNRLYAEEPAIIKREVLRMYRLLSPSMIAAAQEAAGGAVVDVNAVIAGVLETSDELAALVGRRITDTSRDMTLAEVQRWLGEPGATVGDLEERIRPIWEGGRPNAAARTEVTRLNTRVRQQTWEATGLIWGYNVVTRNDSLVRPSHEAAARRGPYPLSDTEHRPPINGDVNCRCGISPVTMAQAERLGLI